MTPNETPVQWTAPDEPMKDTAAQGGPRRRRFISRLRAAANITLFVSGGLFALGWLTLTATAHSWGEARLSTLTTFLAYAGFIAFIAFLTSFTAILIENRTQSETEEGT